ncbi:phosphatase PAP2 family protein [Hyphomonas sp. WL0036]|uniref:acid phosphatase n=1 Tax=Hyphomonas sediminis TaxID=2866160 RepID=UPI001C8194DE|nr:phosphatase PAP2 family protein [Hyphomonas sediminis]MBY9068051.1 phosphatase PAP2 family protein [Hyphomonas sediminis]
MKLYVRSAAVIAAALSLAACQTSSPATEAPPTTQAQIGEMREGTGILNGYLGAGGLPDSAALLPPPPAMDTAAMMADLEAYQTTRALKGTPRWAQAQADNELHFPEAARAFSCTLGVEISEERTPHLAALMRRTLTDAGFSTYRAKQAYQRTRPFALLEEESCVPQEEAALRGDGSYPSGHTAIGWAWGLMLAELAPERADALMKRGYEFGQSRMICGVHWQSDVDAGRVMGAATLAKLHTDPVFLAQAKLARAEIEAGWTAGAAPEACLTAPE